MLNSQILIVDNKTIFQKVKIENTLEFMELLKNFEILHNDILIRDVLYFKFYSDKGIIMVPEGTYLYINTSTKKFVIGQEDMFDILGISALEKK